MSTPFMNFKALTEVGDSRLGALTITQCNGMLAIFCGNCDWPLSWDTTMRVWRCFVPSMPGDGCGLQVIHPRGSSSMAAYTLDSDGRPDPSTQQPLGQWIGEWLNRELSEFYFTITPGA